MKHVMFVYDLAVKTELRDKLIQTVTEDMNVTPGQLRRSGDVFCLTFLRTVRVKNFDPTTWGDVDRDVSCVRATRFRLMNGGIFVHGQKKDATEIDDYLEALAVELSGSEDVADIDPADYFKIDKQVIDLASLLSSYESDGQVKEIVRLRMKQISMSLGEVVDCAVITDNHEAAHGAIMDEDSKVFGMEIQLPEPRNKITVYVDQDGQIRVSSRTKEEDINELVQIADDCAGRIKSSWLLAG